MRQRRTLVSGLAVVAIAILVVSPVLAKGGGGHSGSGARGTGSNPSSHSVGGYTKSNGTHVAPHQQTNPNSTTRDNYNTRGNYNPSNGKTGTRSPAD
jgi:hypothetical protein